MLEISFAVKYIYSSVVFCIDSFLGTSKSETLSRNVSFSRCLTLPLPKLSKTSCRYVLVQPVCARVTQPYLCRTRALVFIESFQTSCARVATLPGTTAPVVRAFMEKSLLTKPVVLRCLTMSSTCSPWRMLAQTPTAASSSSPQCRRLISMANTPFSARCVQRPRQLLRAVCRSHSCHL